MITPGRMRAQWRVGSKRGSKPRAPKASLALLVEEGAASGIMFVQAARALDASRCGTLHRPKSDDQEATAPFARWDPGFPDGNPCAVVEALYLAATNKCLALSNKNPPRGKATKEHD